MKVLYVEDYALGASLVHDTMRRRAPDITLDIVTTVADAIERLRRFEQRGADPALHPDLPRYDAVLTDLNLPDGLGLEILSHVRTRRLPLAVVILTGSGNEDTVIGALHAGANDYLVKRDDYLQMLPGTLRTALAHFGSDAARAAQPLRVLYADADTAGFEQVRAELNRRAPHLQIEPAGSADEVLARVREGGVGAARCDVLLLDHRLPGMPAIELLKEVGNLSAGDLPVVLVTGSGNEQIAQLAIRLGVSDYLNKSDGYLQRLPFALESAHLKATSVRERAALRESEEQFRALFENAIDAILVTVPSGRTVAANASACAMFQRTEAELRELPPGALTHPGDARVAVALSERAVARKWRGELTFVRAGGECFEGEITCAVYEDRTGGDKTCMVIRDITERKQAQERVMHYRDRLEEQVAARTDELARANQALTIARDAADSANRAKSSFLANMSHEIRTPMSSIIGLARLMRPEVTQDKPLDYLGKLQQSADHLLRIINDVLDLSKIEAGQLDLEDSAFDLYRTLAHAIDMLHPRATEKGLSVELAVDPRLPPQLRGDALRLQQIVLNFLGNAIKFTLHGAIRVRADLVEAAADETCLRIEVQDSGIGLSAEQQQRLFQPFSQADTSVSRQYGGTGLGLVIAKRLAALMNGEVGVFSRPGAGSTFWVTVRLRKGAASEVAEPLRPELRAQSIAEFAGARVLLVEDDPVNQLVTSQTLIQLGFEVDVVGNGAEALARVRNQPYALVLMDLQMPVMDGLTATRAIRRVPGLQSLPIIAMTANAFDDDRRLCLEAGMNEHLGKPIRSTEFHAALLRCLPAPAPVSMPPGGG